LRLCIVDGVVAMGVAKRDGVLVGVARRARARVVVRWEGGRGLHYCIEFVCVGGVPFKGGAGMVAGEADAAMFAAHDFTIALKS
jgi:hypothetical protein